MIHMEDVTTEELPTPPAPSYEGIAALMVALGVPVGKIPAVWEAMQWMPIATNPAEAVAVVSNAWQLVQTGQAAPTGPSHPGEAVESGQAPQHAEGATGGDTHQSQMYECRICLAELRESELEGHICPEDAPVAEAPTVAREAKAHTATERRVLAVLAADLSVGIRAAVAANPAVGESPEAVELLSVDTDPAVRQALADNPGLSTTPTLRDDRI